MLMDSSLSKLLCDYKVYKFLGFLKVQDTENTVETIDSFACRLNHAVDRVFILT